MYMIHSTLLSFLHAFKGEQKKHTSLRLAVATSVAFIRDAVQFSFERYCKKKGMSLQKISFQGTGKFQDTMNQSDFFRSARGVIYTHLPTAHQAAGAKRKTPKKDEGVSSKTRTVTEEIRDISKNSDDSILFLSGMQLDVKDPEFSSWHVFSLLEAKPWDVKNILCSWCEWYVHEEGFTCDPSVFLALIEANEGDFHMILSELEKIMTYTWSTKTIHMKDLHYISDLPEKANLFQLFDELLAGSEKGVVREARLIEDDGSIYTIQVLRFLQTQTRNLLRACFQGKEPNFKSKAHEKRLEKAKKLGAFTLEQWIHTTIHHEVQLRNGEVSEDLPSNLSSLCLSLLKITA